MYMYRSYYTCIKWTLVIVLLVSFIVHMYACCNKSAHTWIWICWDALKQYSGCSITQRTIHHVRVSSDPTNVSHTCIHISRLIVKHILHITQQQHMKQETVVDCSVSVSRAPHLLSDGCIEQVASLCVHDALWFASGARGVEHEERILTVQRLRDTAV